jgi:integrase
MGVKVRQIPKASGNWYVIVTHNGERRAQKMSSEDAAEKKAEWVRKRLTSSSDKEAFTPRRRKSALTLGDYADTWKDGHVENNLKWNSRRYYADMLQRIPEEMKARALGEITRDDVRALAFGILGNGLSRSTAAGLLRTLSAIFNSASEDGVYRGANPALRPGRILRIDNGQITEGTGENEESAETDDAAEVDCMDQKESDHFLKVTEEHFGTLYPIALTALRTAARQGEIVALAWDAIDWNGGFITIRHTAVNGELQKTKNRKRRRVPMSSKLAAVLLRQKLRAEEGALAAGKTLSPWIFPSPTGGLMDPSKLRREFKAALKKAKTRGLTFHSLRHTALTTMAERGVPMAALQRIAGHSSIQITAQYYLHVSPETHQETIRALEGLDNMAPGPRADASKMRVEPVGDVENAVSL